MNARLEHANIWAQDMDEMIRFIQTAFPEFRIRHQAERGDGSRWVHIGTDESYVALNEASLERHESDRPYSGYPGVQHLGWEVDDVGALRQRLTAAGYHENPLAEDHPHRKRAYYFDGDGNDWEFVQYLSDNPAERHDYQL